MLLPPLLPSQQRNGWRIVQIWGLICISVQAYFGPYHPYQKLVQNKSRIHWRRSNTQKKVMYRVVSLCIARSLQKQCLSITWAKNFEQSEKLDPNLKMIHFLALLVWYKLMIWQETCLAFCPFKSLYNSTKLVYSHKVSCSVDGSTSAVKKC